MSAELEKFKNLGEVMLRSNRGDHFQALGIHLESFEKNKAVMRLDYHHSIVGNPITGAVSGGAITALMDTCCGFVATTEQQPIGLTPTIDLRIDYMGEAVAGKPIYAESHVYRITRHVIFLRSVAYQDKDKPIAYSTGNFMNMATPAKFSGMMDLVINNVDKLPAAVTRNDDVSVIDVDKMIELINTSQKNKDVSALIEHIPYATFLGIERLPEQDTDKYVFKMPAKKALVGNPTLPAIHGGALGGFMETSAMLHLMIKMEERSMPKVVDFSLDFIRTGKMLDTFVRCKIIRFGRKLVNLSVEAWQENENTPIAKARLQVLID